MDGLTGLGFAKSCVLLGEWRVIALVVAFVRRWRKAALR